MNRRTRDLLIAACAGTGATAVGEFYLAIWADDAALATRYGNTGFLALVVALVLGFIAIFGEINR